MQVRHQKQRGVWESEHKNPCVFPHLDRNEVSGGVVEFWSWIKKFKNSAPGPIRGLEICCGKGRNVLWLAGQGAHMIGFDFAKHAIRTARSRMPYEQKGRAIFLCHDAISRWPFKSKSFDFTIDCFGSTDIEGEINRSFVRQEILRVLKLGGHHFLYTNSVKSEFYKKMAAQKVSGEKNAYRYPETGKFEKVYDDEELREAYSNFILVESRVFSRTSLVFNNKYTWHHYWNIYQKPEVCHA